MSVAVAAFLLLTGFDVREVMIGMFFLAGTAIWVGTLLDCVTKEADAGNHKVAWVVVIALTHIIGAAVYLFVRRPQRIAELGR